MVSQTRWSSTRGGWSNRWSFARVGCIMPYIIYMKISCLVPVFTRKKWVFTTFQPPGTGIFLARWITPLPIWELFSFQGRSTVEKFHSHSFLSCEYGYQATNFHINYVRHNTAHSCKAPPIAPPSSGGRPPRLGDHFYSDTSAVSQKRDHCTI